MINYFFGTGLDGKGVKMEPATQYVSLIPRFISSLMMHLNVEPKVRQGIDMMKYAVNQPQKFRVIKQGYEIESPLSVSYYGMRRRAFCAFLLGMSQASIGIVAELQIIFFLSTRKKFLDIIVQFVSLAAVTKFDDFYATALHDIAIKAAVGTRLLQSQNRFERYKKSNKDDSSEPNLSGKKVTEKLLDSDEGVEGESDPNSVVLAKLKESLPIHIMRFVHKIFRIYFVTFGFYYVSLAPLLISFFASKRRE